MGKIIKGSVRDRVREAVTRLGTASVDQVLAVVGKSLPMSSVAAAVRNTKRQGWLGDGARLLVKNALASLARKGEVRRLSKGVYAPVEPAGSPRKESMIDVVQKAVDALGVGTVEQIAAVVRKGISPSRIAMATHRQGRRGCDGARLLVCESLAHLYKRKRVRRVSKGVYSKLLKVVTEETA